MVKFIIAILLAIPIFGANLNNFVEGLVGKAVYNSQKSRLNSMFADKSRFMDNGELKLDEIVKTLRINGLFPLSFKKPQSLNITFKANNGLILLKAINSALESMGYTYYLSKSLTYEEDELSWEISLTTQHLLDPSLLNESLKKSNCRLILAQKLTDTNWIYTIDTSDIKLIATKFETNRQIETTKPLKPYVIDISNASSIEIRASISDTWFAKIRFLDVNLGLLEEISLDEKRYEMKLDIPEFAKYMIIDDKYSLENIKRGLNLYLNAK